jgi:hypothetical protein
MRSRCLPQHDSKHQHAEPGRQTAANLLTRDEARRSELTLQRSRSTGAAVHRHEKPSGTGTSRAGQNHSHLRRLWHTGQLGFAWANSTSARCLVEQPSQTRVNRRRPSLGRSLGLPPLASYMAIKADSSALALSLRVPAGGVFVNDMARFLGESGSTVTWPSVSAPLPPLGGASSL